MPIKLKANNGNIDLKVPIQQIGGKVDSVNGMTGDVVLDIPSNTSQLINDSGFITEHQDISGLATKSDIKTVEDKITTLDDKVAAIDVPSLDGYATEQWVEAKGYLTEHQSLENYALKSEIPTKTSDLTNDSGFLTEHQSLADYSTTTQVQSMINTAISSITDGNEVSY